MLWRVVNDRRTLRQKQWLRRHKLRLIALLFSSFASEPFFFLGRYGAMTASGHSGNLSKRKARFEEAFYKCGISFSHPTNLLAPGFCCGESIFYALSYKISFKLCDCRDNNENDMT